MARHVHLFQRHVWATLDWGQEAAFQRNILGIATRTEQELEATNVAPGIPTSNKKLLGWRPSLLGWRPSPNGQGQV